MQATYVCERCGVKGSKEVHVLPQGWEQVSGDYLCKECYLGWCKWLQQVNTNIPDRQEFHHFNVDQLYAIEGRDLNVLWRAATILCAGEMSRLNGDQRRDLGQLMQTALGRAL